MVQMMAVHLDRPECDAGYSGTLLSKDEESEPKELRMPQNINALLLCFAEQYEVMKKRNHPARQIWTRWESLMNLFAYWIGGTANSSS